MLLRFKKHSCDGTVNHTVAILDPLISNITVLPMKKKSQMSGMSAEV